jgi:predicted  nucleic acid-binding Zn-ribbon protein
MARLGRMTLGALVAISWGAPALAQDAYQSAQSELADVLSEIEGNFIEKEAIEMNFADWQAKFNGLKPRLDELNQRYEDLNAYCQGTYEEDEYNRRLAYCQGAGAQLDTLKAQLQPEAEALDQQVALLQERDSRRQAAGTELGGRLTAGIEHLVAACIAMPLETQRELCHLPPAPGPRTADMVATINADLAGS